jgi:hypothetical protein
VDATGHYSMPPDDNKPEARRIKKALRLYQELLNRLPAPQPANTPKFKPLWGFEYDHGYQEAYCARVRLAELEAIEMDQIAGIKHVMKRYLAGVREAGTLRGDRWPILRFGA